MKKTFFATLIIFSLASCVTASDKNLIEKEFPITEFTSINSNVIGNITMIQSDTTSLIVYGNDTLIEKLIIKNENNTLFISSEKYKDKTRNFKFTITITTPKIENIISEGVGNITLSNNWEIDILNIHSMGVGNIYFKNTTANTLSINNEGVGNITLNGKGDYVIINSDGVGNIKAKNFIAKNVKLQCDGIGNINCFASDNIEINMDGVGNISYYGNPQIKTINNTGIGKIKCR